MSGGPGLVSGTGGGSDGVGRNLVTKVKGIWTLSWWQCGIAGTF